MNHNLTQLHDCEYVYRYKVSNVNSKNKISVSAVLLPNNIAFTNSRFHQQPLFSHLRDCAQNHSFGGALKSGYSYNKKINEYFQQRSSLFRKVALQKFHRKRCSENMQQNLLDIFRTLFPMSITGGLLLSLFNKAAGIWPTALLKMNLFAGVFQCFKLLFRRVFMFFLTFSKKLVSEPVWMAASVS